MSVCVLRPRGIIGTDTMTYISNYWARLNGKFHNGNYDCYPYLSSYSTYS